MLLNASIYIVFALLLIVSALLLLVVLMQRPKQEGLGAAFGAQMTDQAFGAQTTDVLKKGTVLFGTLFMLLSFVLAVLMNRQFQMQKSDLATGEAVVVRQEKPANEGAVNLDALDPNNSAQPQPAAPAAQAEPAEPAAAAQPAAQEAPAEPAAAAQPAAPETPAQPEQAVPAAAPDAAPAA